MPTGSVHVARGGTQAYKACKVFSSWELKLTNVATHQSAWLVNESRAESWGAEPFPVSRYSVQLHLAGFRACSGAACKGVGMAARSWRCCGCSTRPIDTTRHAHPLKTTAPRDATRVAHPPTHIIRVHPSKKP